MKLEDMTPEQRENVDAVIEAWLNCMVETKTAEDGTRLFRLRDSMEEGEPEK